MGNNENVSLADIPKEKLFALGAGMAAGAGALLEVRRAWRKWRKNRPRNEDFYKRGGAKLLIKVTFPKLKDRSRS